MLRKSIFLLLMGVSISVAFLSLLQSLLIENTKATSHIKLQRDSKYSKDDLLFNLDLNPWIITDETSTWKEEEKEILLRVLSNTFGALAEVGLDGYEIFDGYSFRRFQGEYANNREGKIAVVSFTVQEIILSDSIFLPENEFFIYHELGHIVDLRSGFVLGEQFHKLTLQTEGAASMHDWTTVQGFFLRGQAHVRKPEAVADAFALWVCVKFANLEPPQFHDMPKNANPEAILEVIDQAINLSLE